MRDAFVRDALRWRRDLIAKYNWMIPGAIAEMVVFVSAAGDNRDSWVFWFGVIGAAVVGAVAMLAVYQREALVDAVRRIERGEDIWS